MVKRGLLPLKYTALARTSLVVPETLSELSMSLIFPRVFFSIQALIILAAAAAAEKSIWSQQCWKIIPKPPHSLEKFLNPNLFNSHSWRFSRKSSCRDISTSKQVGSPFSFQIKTDPPFQLHYYVIAISLALTVTNSTYLLNITVKVRHECCLVFPQHF